MKIYVTLHLAEFFHGNAITLGLILGLLAILFLFAAGR